MNYTDIDNEIRLLEEHLKRRTEFIQHVAGALLTQLQDPDIGIPKGELDLLQIADDVEGEAVKHLVQLRGKDQNGCVGFGVRFQKHIGMFLADVAMLVKWQFDVAENEVTARAGDDGHSIPGRLDDPGNAKFIEELRGKTVEHIVTGFQRMRGGDSISQELGFHRIAKDGQSAPRD